MSRQQYGRYRSHIVGNNTISRALVAGMHGSIINSAQNDMLCIMSKDTIFTSHNTHHRECSFPQLEKPN
jgi:hypothetical protein